MAEHGYLKRFQLVIFRRMALFALFFIVKSETNGQIITVPAELHTSIDLPCICPICPESIFAVQWYKSSRSDVYVQDGKALAWWYEGETGSSQGFGIKDDFSMMIYNLTDKHDQELYRCIISLVSGAAECTHDVKLGIYAKPDTSPVIEYIRVANGFNVTCSIGNVFPMTFPILTDEGRNGTSYIGRDRALNIDGTYNANVTYWFPANEKDTIMECVYSNFNLKVMSSLRIVDNYIINQTKDGDRMPKNMADTDFRYPPSGLWMVWTIFIIQVLFFIVIVYAIKSGRVTFHPVQLTTIGNSKYKIGRNGHLGENITVDANSPEDIPVDRGDQHEENTSVDENDPEDIPVDRGDHDGKKSEDDEPVESTRILQLFSKRSCRAVAILTIQITVLILLATYIATVRVE